MAEELTLLCVHPHPDDESISCGGLLALCADEGIRTVVVTCTDGAEGENLAGIDLGDEDLVTHRRRELDEALEILSVGAHHHLGYRDSGMAGSRANDDPRSFHAAPLDEAALRLARIIREERPQVVVCDDEAGSYGHPDHVKANRVTERAVALAADADAAVEGQPWRVVRRFAHTISHSRLLALHRMLVAAGLSSPFGDGDVEHAEDLGLGVPDEQVTADIDVTDVVDRKRKAMRAHRSQIGHDSFFLNVPDEQLPDAFACEQFVLQEGDSPQRVPTDDLFDGIRGAGGALGTPDSSAFRAALGRFPTGVTVVTTEDDGVVHGMTVNAFTSVSLDPPLVLVCIDESAVMADMIDRAGRFGVSVLGADQAELSTWFADPRRPIGREEFEGVRVVRGSTDVPLLADGVVSLECQVWATYDGGDHRIVVGLVEAIIEDREADSLVFDQGRYGRFVPE